MKGLLMVLAAMAAGMATAGPGRRPPPRRPHRPPPPPPAVFPHRVRPPGWGWGVNVGPWSGSLSVGTRVGRRGFIGTSWPIFPPPVPVVERQTTIVVQPPAQEVIEAKTAREEAGEDAEKAQTAREPGILPAFAPRADGSPRTWVEGHWKVTRGLDGEELTRTWVPGHWE